MKKALVFFLIAAMSIAVFQPIGGSASSELDKINKELNQVKRDMEKASNVQAEAEANQKKIDKAKNEAVAAIQAIMNQIDTVAAEMQEVNEQIETKEAELDEATQNLAAAEERIVSRDKLLKSRIRLLYSRGFVSYMDVLFSSTSFADFLDRFEALQSILGQDKDILEEHKQDKELIVASKVQIEEGLEEVRVLYAELDAHHTSLLDKEKEKEVMIAQYNEELDNIGEISEEAEALLMALAKKMSNLEKKKKEATAKYYNGGKMQRPIASGYKITSSFGARTHPITGEKGKMHNGVDFGAPSGTNIYAAEAGVVIVAQAWSGYGNCIIIDHGGGIWTLYGHIRKNGIKVKKGDKVKRGQVIAEVGSTGQSTGPHLHFEVRKNEKPVNPMSYIR